jgi:AraC-like DNA-binding protein
MLIIRLYPALTHAMIATPARRKDPLVPPCRSVDFDQLGRDNLARREDKGFRSPFCRIDYPAAWSSPACADQQCDLLEQLLRLNAMRDPEDRYIIRLFQLLIQRAYELLRSQDAERFSSGWHLYRSAVEFISAHMAEPLDRNQVAEHLGVHPKHVSYLFKRFGVETFTDFLMRKRLSHGLALLSRGALSVKEIAAASGFSSSRYFIRCFSKRFGVTPGQYRVSQIHAHCEDP